jgi:D-alanine-D-alanine ligase
MSEATRVAVLMGGPSQEHDISLKSGQGVSVALSAEGFIVDLLTVPRGLSLENASDWVHNELVRLQPGAVFIAAHGAFGEDGTLQQVCDDLRLPYTGSDTAASRIGMNKIASRMRFSEAGLSVPRWRQLAAASWQAYDLETFSFPLVVKPVDQGSSIGVSFVDAPDALPEAIEAAARYGDSVLVEECVLGRELTVGVLGTRALPVIEVVPKHRFFDFSAKYTAGMTDYRVPAQLPQDLEQRVQATGWRAHQALGCRHLSRTDLILNQRQECVVLEVNTIPGFTPTSLLPKAAACVGISYNTLCRELVIMALKSAPHLAAGAPK